MMNLPLLIVEELMNVEAKGGLFDFNATLPLMALQFLLLTLALNIIFYKPVGKILDERNEYIRNTLTTASAYLLRANELTQKYEQELAESRKNAQDIIKNSQQQAQQVVSVNIKNAQLESEKLVDEAFIQLNIQKEEALKTLETQVDNLSEQIKFKLLNT